MHRTQNKKAPLHWVKEFYCISGGPTKVDLNKAMFIQQFDTALPRKETRKNLIDQPTTKAKEYSVEPLETENKWK